LQAQATGKAKGRQKRLKAFGTVNIPQEAFIGVLKA
jgi:translation elongation factor EF-4